jgi:hypothetical protein
VFFGEELVTKIVGWSPRFLKLLTAFVRKADEGTIGKLIESVILLTTRTQADGGKTLCKLSSTFAKFY